MSVLIDSSVWIEYFRGRGEADVVDALIEENLVAINDLILAELLPGLQLRREKQLIGLLKEIQRYPMAVDWGHLVTMQVVCLQNGINKVGIPDLMIAQNAMLNGLSLYSLDRHFRLMAGHLPLKIHAG